MQDNQAQAASAAKDARLGITISVLATTIIASYTAGAMPVFADGLQKHFGLDYGQLGMLLAVGTVGSLISLVLVGPLTQLWGLRRVLFVALWGSGIGYLLLGVSRSLFLFAPALLFLALFSASLGISVPAFLVRIYPALRRRMLTVSLLSSAIPGLLYPLLAQYLLGIVTSDGTGRSFAWVLHIPFLVVGCAVAIMPLWLLAMLRGTPEAADARETGRIHWHTLTRPSTLGIFVLMGFHASADGGLCTWYPKMMGTQIGRLPLAPGTVMSLMAAAYLLSRSTLALAPEGVLQRALLVLPGPIGTALLLTGLWSGHPLLLCICLPLGALFWSLEWPAMLSELASRAGEDFASWLAAALIVCGVMNAGVINMVGQLGQVTGDLRVGLTVASLGFVIFGAGSYFAGLGRHTAQGDIPQSIAPSDGHEST